MWARSAANTNRNAGAEVRSNVIYTPALYTVWLVGGWVSGDVNVTLNADGSFEAIESYVSGGGIGILIMVNGIRGVYSVNETAGQIALWVDRIWTSALGGMWMPGSLSTSGEVTYTRTGDTWRVTAASGQSGFINGKTFSRVN